MKVAIILALLCALVAVNAQECEVCKLAVGYIENAIGSNSTTQQVEAFLEKVCNESLIKRLGLTAECDSLVESYYPQLVQFIIHDEDPTTACTQIGLCTGARSLGRHARHARRMKEKLRGELPFKKGRIPKNL